MLRSTDTLRDVTSPAGGAVSTGPLNVSQCEQVIVWFIASGAAAPTNCTVSLCDANGAQILSKSITVAIGGSTPAFVGEGPAPGVTNVVALGPVPPAIFASGSGGAASTLRIVVLGLPRATFQAIDYPTPIIPEDANTVAHVWWQDGTGLIDTKGNTWTMNGAVPQVARTVMAPGGSGPFSITNKYSLGTGADVLDFAADFSVCFVFAGVADASFPGLFADANGTNAGYEFLISNTGAFGAAYYTTVQVLPAPSPNLVVNGVNVGCCGVAGTGWLTKLNLGSIATANMATRFNPPTAVAALLGSRSQSAPFILGTLYEAWFSTTTPTDGVFTNIMQTVKSRLRITAW